MFLVTSSLSNPTISRSGGGWVGVLDEIKAISAFNLVEVEVEAWAWQKREYMENKEYIKDSWNEDKS